MFFFGVVIGVMVSSDSKCHSADRFCWGSVTSCPDELIEPSQKTQKLREKSISHSDGDNCNCAKAPTATRFSRMSTKHDSLPIVMRTAEEHIADSSREWSIVLPLSSEETMTEEKRPQETI